MSTIILLYSKSEYIYYYNDQIYTNSQILQLIYKNSKIKIEKIIITDSRNFKLSDLDQKVIYLLSTKYTTIYSPVQLNLNETHFTKVSDDHFYKIVENFHFEIEKEIFKLYILIPYRARGSQQFREKMLIKFKEYTSKYLDNFGIDYSLIICEQNDDAPFNRGALLNAGFLEIEKQQHNKIPYYCHHNIDLFPINNAVNYTYIHGLRDIWGFEKGIGGICIFDRTNFKKSGGFPNDCLVWGGEDILLKARYDYLSIKIDRKVYNNKETVKEIGHARDNSENKNNMEKIKNNKTGLWNCNYQCFIDQATDHYLFTFN